MKLTYLIIFQKNNFMKNKILYYIKFFFFFRLATDKDLKYSHINVILKDKKAEIVNKHENSSKIKIKFTSNSSNSKDDTIIDDKDRHISSSNFDSNAEDKMETLFNENQNNENENHHKLNDVHNNLSKNKEKYSNQISYILETKGI